MDTENMKVQFQGGQSSVKSNNGGYGIAYENSPDPLDTDERSTMKAIPVQRDPAEIRDYLNDG